MRRSPHMNLHRDGFEHCAEVISDRARKAARYSERMHVHVAPDGGVYCGPNRKVVAAPTWELIGVYDANCRVEHIEDDLLAWLREQQIHEAA